MVVGLRFQGRPPAAANPSLCGATASRYPFFAHLRAANVAFALTVGNTNPQGIAMLSRQNSLT